MEPVLCDICKNRVLPIDCWCVIDTKTKIRFYECKTPCKKPVEPVAVEPTAASDEILVAQIQLELQALEELGTQIQAHLDSNEERVTEWTEAYARPSLFQRLKQWFRTPRGYTKVKTS